MSKVDVNEIFSVISELESIKKQATVERSHFYVDVVATDAIKLLYKYAKTLGENK